MHGWQTTVVVHLEYAAIAHNTVVRALGLGRITCAQLINGSPRVKMRRPRSFMQPRKVAFNDETDVLVTDIVRSMCRRARLGLESASGVRRDTW